MNYSFEIIVLSAFFHASWNVLIKMSKNKTQSTKYMLTVATVAGTIFMLIYDRNLLLVDINKMYLPIISAFFFSMYQLFTATAYKYGDVSLVYPITTAAPLFIVIWAYLFLGERISAIGFVGILLIVGGCIFMNSTRGSNKLAVKAVLYALLAAWVYSFGALADKLGVSEFNPLTYIYWMTFFSMVFSWIFVTIIYRKEEHSKIEWKLVIAAGIIVYASTAAFRIGLVDIEISYAAAVRQVSALFGLLIGVFFFKESSGVRRLIACLIILFGVTLIRLFN